MYDNVSESISQPVHDMKHVLWA
uniref:Uncharacterized protein n=1 Tax=Anguilla anguilla TaxID=7936 RepID=A0A0E9QMM4_ANGAN